MSGNQAKILIDLNAPRFLDAFLDLETSELRKTLKTLKKLRGITWNDLFRDHGLKWEEIKSMPGRYTIRLSKSCRAVALREGNWMRFLAIHVDHDSTYTQK